MEMGPLTQVWHPHPVLYDKVSSPAPGMTSPAQRTHVENVQAQHPPPAAANNMQLESYPAQVFVVIIGVKVPLITLAVFLKKHTRWNDTEHEARSQ